MFHVQYSEGLRRQPAMLERRRPEIVHGAQLIADRVTQSTTTQSTVVGIVGIGASYAAAMCAEVALRDLGTRAVALEAGSLSTSAARGAADVYVAVSASGKSAETLQVLRWVRARATGAPLCVGITAEGANPMTALVDLELVCGVEEDSVPATTSFAGSLQALAFVAFALAGLPTGELEGQWARAPGAVSATIAVASEALGEISRRFASLDAVDIVATTKALGIAAEGALLFREADRLPAAAFGSHSYLHGPMEALEPRRGLVVVGDPAEEAATVALEQAVSLGCPVVVIGGAAAPEGTVHVPVLGEALLEQLLWAVSLQVLTEQCSATLGLTSGRFRYPQPQIKLEHVP